MYQSVLDFWFQELEPNRWFTRDDSVDERIREQFEVLLMAARQNELYSWRSDPKGSLAEIIVLDQFTRNIHRDSAQAFENDPLALALAQSAIEKGFDQKLATIERHFLYMPFMHSESRKIHEVALSLYEASGSESGLEFEIKHKAVIDRFGRYPHRNEVLGRISTAEEIEFLKQPGSGF